MKDTETKEPEMKEENGIPTFFDDKGNKIEGVIEEDGYFKIPHKGGILKVKKPKTYDERCREWDSREVEHNDQLVEVDL